MYPNSDLSAGTLAIIAVVAVACLVIWIGGGVRRRPPAAPRPHRRDDLASAAPGGHGSTRAQEAA